MGYMHKDENENTFFANLNLFIFFMLILVLSGNYLLMFVGWEGVGLCSYLLIGHWYKNNSFNYAARKAFVMNRIGDLAFLVGIFVMVMTFQSVDFGTVFTATASYPLGDSTLTIITLCLLIGAFGKSAQIPLFTWLPDAMAGPTPVSALIHAATMVTAGIYMVARSSSMFVLTPLTMNIILIVGLLTALIAAITATKQNDIKKVLAYSTVSQLGFMFVALGLGAFSTAIFHVTTHAFFKALLFLGAGSVIHAMNNQQDIRAMGGLKKHLPVTYLTFLIATLAISGVPPFAGFFSKDEILVKAFEYSPIVWGVLMSIALMTCYYMFRLFYLVFLGNFRGSHEQEHHLHEVKSMRFPLIILAILSTVGGFINIPAFLGGSERFSHYLHTSILATSTHVAHLELSIELILLFVTLLLIGIVIFLAYKHFVSKANIPASESVERKGFEKVVYNKFYFDEIYDALFAKPFQKISNYFTQKLDELTDRLTVQSTSNLVKWLGLKLNLLQNGLITFYVFAMVVSIICFMVLVIFI